MVLIYFFSLIFLMFSFMSMKKSDKEQNFIKWLIIGFVSIYAYNIFIGMVLGMIGIKASLPVLGLINVAVGVALIWRFVTKKERQKYFCTKIQIAGLLLIIVVCTVMFVKDLYIYNGDISHWAVDSAVHYRAAKHYADYQKIFINIEDRSFFNFNVMQPGAYINDGIFMKTFYGLTGVNYAYLFQAFETITLFVSGLAFYAFFIDKLKTKRGLVGSIILFILYIYGYPYNSWIYGFSYLSVGIVMIAGLMSVVEMMFSEDEISKKVAIPLIGLLSFGLIFSYCLFVPAIFAAICIYVFLKELKSEKKYLKIFGKYTLIITGMLVVITACGIGYLFIPTFFIEGQTDLVSALKIDGQIYSETYKDFIAYIPIAVLYVFDLFKRIKERKIKYFDVFAVIMIGYLLLLIVGVHIEKVALYYMFKNYFIVWMVVLGAAVQMVNTYVDEKLFRFDYICMIGLFALFLLKGWGSDKIFRTYLMLVLVLYVVLPQLLERINISKLENNKIYSYIKKNGLKVSVVTYVVIWGIFVGSWVWLKAGHLIGEEVKHALPNLVGIYYIENCEYRKLIDLNNNFNSNEIELTTYARENLKDMTVENTELITEGYFTRIWATAMLEFSSKDIPYQNVVQDTNIYTVDDAVKDNEKKYIVKLVSKDQTKLNEYNEVIQNVKKMNNIEILKENDNGFVAKINRE